MGLIRGRRATSIASRRGICIPAKAGAGENLALSETISSDVNKGVVRCQRGEGCLIPGTPLPRRGGHGDLLVTKDVQLWWWRGILGLALARLLLFRLPVRGFLSGEADTCTRFSETKGGTATGSSGLSDQA